MLFKAGRDCPPPSEVQLACPRSALCVRVERANDAMNTEVVAELLAAIAIRLEADAARDMQGEALGVDGGPEVPSDKERRVEHSVGRAT